MSERPNEPQFVTCPCQVCSGKIEFDASDFGQGETRTVECPFCKMATMIFVPVSPNAPKPTQNKTPPAKPNPLATKPASNQKELFSVKVTSRTVAVFFAITTFCLASILVWEHLPGRSQPVSGNQITSGNEPVSAGKIEGSEIITVHWGESVNKFRLDEVTFESLGGGFTVQLKSNGRRVGILDGGDLQKVNAYLHGK